MLFFTRCVLCIGTIVVLVEGIDLSDLTAPTGTLARGATARIESYCHDKPTQCLAVAAAALQAGQGAGPVGEHAASPAPARPLRPAPPHRVPHPDLSLRHPSPK